MERQSDTIVHIAKEKEELTKDKASLAVQLTAAERENRQQSEVLEVFTCSDFVTASSVI